MAGNMGIEEELIDSDYPTLLVHNDTWNKMKWSFQNNHAMMLAISEHQTEMGVHAYIEVQDPSDPESMMSLTLENKVESREIDVITANLE